MTALLLKKAVLNFFGGSWDESVSELLRIGFSSYKIYKQLHRIGYLNGAKKKIKSSLSNKQKITLKR